MYLHNFYDHPYFYNYGASNPQLLDNQLYFKVNSSIFDFSSSTVSYDHSLKNSFTDLLPMAVRYFSKTFTHTNYLIERPPFKAFVDYSLGKSYNKRRLNKNIQGKEIWIPWTLLLVSISNDPRSFYSSSSYSLFFNDTQLYSLHDTVIPSFFPNSGASSGQMCLGSELSSRIQNPLDIPIKDIANAIYNDYFSGGWNSDILNTIPYTPVFIDLFDSLSREDNKLFNNSSSLPDIFNLLKKAQKSKKDNEVPLGYSYNNSSFIDFFYVYSQLTLEQSLQYFSELKSSYHQRKPLSQLSHVFVPQEIYSYYSRKFSPLQHAGIDKSTLIHNIADLNHAVNQYPFFNFSSSYSGHISVRGADLKMHNLDKIMAHPKIISKIYLHLFAKHTNPTSNIECSSFDIAELDLTEVSFHASN